MIPEEDRGPAWLRDYGYTDFSQIEADIAAMEHFAQKLQAAVENNYETHLPGVTGAMMTRLPDPPAAFSELCSFLIVHRDAQDVTHQNVFNFANGTQGFARAAADIGERYDGSDAFAKTKVADVSLAFAKVGLPDSAVEGDT